jgi:uncharacterized protein (TIGR01777 family)
MKILMTGATGWVGRSIGVDLVRRGHQIVALVRDPQKAAMQCPFPAQWIFWDYSQGQEVDSEVFQGVDAILHLMGEPVAGARWNEEVKQEISRSRVLSTQQLAELAKKHSIKNFISASAIGYYGERADEELTEASSNGEGFLAQVCKDWEAELFKNEKFYRSVALRIGVVLGRGGGALEKMLTPFRYGVGGKLGSGSQWMSWIHLDDLKAMILRALEDTTLQGVYNATAPQAVAQKDFAKALAKVLHRPAFLPAPSLALNLALGEMAAVILGSAKVVPRRFQEMGFTYKFADLNAALADLFGDLQAGEVELVTHQFIPKSKEDLFPFFADEYNLEKLTPPFLNFKVLGKSTEKIEENCLIEYRLSLHGIPFKWRTQILNWQPPHQFVDYQLSGPYRKWHHTHTFEKLGNGTLMTDRVIYKLPLGYLGYVGAHWKVSSDVETIFKYRRQVIFSMFSS